MNDRLLGYFILILLVLILFIPILFFIRQNLAPIKICTVEFKNIKNISFISKEDPVRLQGVQIGVVGDITTDYEKTIVLLYLNKPLQLFKGYKVTAYLKGLMGDRYVSVQQGDVYSTPIQLNEVLEGDFLDGPTEIVGYIGRVKSLLQDLNIIVDALKDGTAEKKSFVSQFASFYQKIDTLSTSIYSLTRNIDRTMDKNRDTIQHLLNQTLTITDSLSKTLPDILNDTKNTFSSTHTFITQVDSFIVKVDTVIALIVDPKSILWQEDAKNLHTDLLSLQKMLDDVRVNGLNLPVRLRQKKVMN
jgi:ABC-type transporter Mla subunit MlaD